jgi:ribosomal protein S18 acetylase RimI-like enzyme
MIRPTVPDDTPVLLELAEETGVFKPLEIQALREVLDDYHAINREAGHRSVTCEQAGRVVGFAYYAPAAMTDRSWYLYWIAVRKPIQARGIGGELLRHAEAEIRQAAGRVLFIETSSLPHYELTRRFYLKHGYEQMAVLRDFYADGDDMVVFRKRLSTGSAPPGTVTAAAGQPHGSMAYCMPSRDASRRITSASSASGRQPLMSAASSSPPARR